MSEDFLALTSDIVIAHLNHNRVEPAALPDLIRSTYAALTTLGQAAATPAPAAPVPAVPIRASVKPDHLVCLEDGRKLTMLKRYLRATYDMSPEDYRAKWGLPADYPMVAPSYSDRRRAIAADIGLGRTRAAAPVGADTIPTPPTDDIETIDLAPEPESMMVAETPAPAKKNTASRAKAKAVPEIAPAAEPAPAAEALAPAKKPRVKKVAPTAAPERDLAPVEVPAPIQAPAPALADPAPAPEASASEAPASTPEAPAAEAPAPAAKPERKKLSIVLAKAPVLDPEAPAPRPRLKPRIETPVIEAAPEPVPAPRVQNIEEDSALIVQSIESRRCLRWVYNRTAMVVAPYVLYTSRDELFVDAVAYEKNGVIPTETKLGRFKLTGLSALQATTRPFPAGTKPDMADARYQEKVLAQA